MAGNPNPKGSKPDKLMRDALMVALNREAIDANGHPTKRLYVIAERLAAKAESGDTDALSAIREVFDRVDGKPTQTIAGDAENPIFPIEGLRALLETKLDRIANAGTAAEAQKLLN